MLIAPITEHAEKELKLDETFLSILFTLCAVTEDSPMQPSLLSVFLTERFFCRRQGVY